ncbi:MAG TPA: periplasmic heavy metal sensor [Chitinophagales bacterium]|nr:periplasmic heavy metal sensor [Chitinophagales bacterium]
MKLIEKPKFLLGIIAVLLIIDIGMVAFIWMGPGRPHNVGRPDNSRFLIDELKMDQNQQQQYEKLKMQLHRQLGEVQHKDRELHDRFFSLFSAPSVDSAELEQIVDSIGASRKEIELITFRHFQQVRALCTPEQQKKFDKVIGEMMKLMGPHPGGPPTGKNGDGPPPPPEGGENGPPADN